MNNFIFNKEQSFVMHNVYCKYYLMDIKKPLMVTFGAANSHIASSELVNSPSPWAFDYIKKKGINVISFSSIDSDCWYRNKEFHNYLKSVSKNISIFSERLGYGGSMGAYGISAYSNTLNLTRVLLFCPVSTLNKIIVPFEDRFEINSRTKDWEEYIP